MPTLRARRAFTLLEMLIAMGLTLMMFAMVVPFFRVQLRALGKNAGRLDAQQNVRFALASIQRELRVAGSGVVDAQPMIVQAAANGITFNVDLVSQDSADPSAVYFDRDANSGATTSLTPALPINLPISGRKYPDTTYWESPGLTSRAETISYWLSNDPQNPGQYILFRRVNGADSTIVSSGITLTSGQPFFRYYVENGTGGIDSVPQASLPLIHTAKIHGSPADIGNSALTDQIRMVRVSMNGTMTDPDTHKPVLRHLEGAIRLLNAGLVQHPTCGNPPLGTTLTAAVQTDPVSGQKFVQLTWPPSTDEKSGEKDIEHYLIFRRPSTQTNYGDAMANVGAGQTSNYVYPDYNVQLGDHWIYGVVAEDCTPASSPLSESDPGPVN